MRIGIFADSHDHLDNIRRAVAVFNEHDCELVVFAGNLVSTVAIPPLRQLNCPLIGCFGDNEGNRIGIRSGMSIVGHLAEPPFGFRAPDGTRILVTHQRELLRGRADGSEVVIFGHMHRASIRRDGDGAKGFWRGEKWYVDGWRTRPVPFAQHLPHDRNFDSSNDQQEFIGLYTAYKTEPGKAADFYFLRLADYSGTQRSANLNTGDFDYNAFGTRLQGSRGDLRWEFEGGYQFGQFGPDDIQAGCYTVGLGHKRERVRWQPTFGALLRLGFRRLESQRWPGEHGQPVLFFRA